MSMYYIGIYPLDPYYLEHHGIKGQRWGERRWQNLDGSLTPEGYEHYYGIRADKGAIILEKGREVYRTTVDKNEKNEGHAYVSATDVDRAHYRGGGGEWIKQTSGGDYKTKLYEDTYRLTRDLKIATLDSIKEAYDDLIKKDPEIKKHVDETFAKYQSDSYEDAKYEYEMDKKWAKENNDKKMERQVDKKWKEEQRKYTDTASLDDNLKYGWFSVSLGAQPYNREAITKWLKDKGYDGMLDRASMGIKGISRLEGVAPIIMFERSTSMAKVKQVVIKNRETLKSERDYQKWYNDVQNALTIRNVVEAYSA